jgi:hypothetical protein
MDAVVVGVQGPAAANPLCPGAGGAYNARSNRKFQLGTLFVHSVDFLEAGFWPAPA